MSAPEVTLPPLAVTVPATRFRRLCRWLAAGIILVLIAPLAAPQDPYALAGLSLLDAKLPPGSVGSTGMTYWLGADAQGRDLLSAILFGLRLSLLIALATVCAAGALGSLAGLTAALLGGFWRTLIMRAVDLQLSIPALFMALVLATVLGRGVLQVGLALVLTQWAVFARTAYLVALAERDRDYIRVAEGLGLGRARVILHHLLPNCLPPLLVLAIIQTGNAITLEATLSFLGLGLPITEPSLGLLVKNGFDYVFSGRVWMSLAPGLALAATVMAIHAVGDRLRAAVNPRSR